MKINAHSFSQQWLKKNSINANTENESNPIEITNHKSRVFLASMNYDACIVAFVNLHMINRGIRVKRALLSLPQIGGFIRIIL